MQSTSLETHPVLQPAHSLTNGQLAAVTLGRLALNVAYRIVYPLQPFLAQHLHVGLRTVTALVTVQVLASIASPLGGALADARGERTIMTGGLALFCLGATLCALSSSFGGFLAGYALIGLAVALYQPAAQAYLSARTSYARRGQALGVFETSWAGAALLGVAPLMQLVQSTNDSAWVFWIVLAAAGCSLALVRFGLPPATQHSGARQKLNWTALRAPRVFGMVALLFMSAMAIDLIFVVQGVWAKTSFGAGAGQLGQVFALMGVAELAGSLGSTVLVDRVGKKRAVLSGYTLVALAMLALPLSQGSWPVFVGLFFVFDLCFEFSVVSAYPLASGIAPAVRGTVMALSLMMSGLGKALGSQLAEPLWSSHGIWANSLVGGAMTITGVLLCFALVRETEAFADGREENRPRI